MCVTPAEPLGDRATKLAFELNIVCAMLRTVSDTGADAYCRALTAN